MRRLAIAVAAVVVGLILAGIVSTRLNQAMQDPVVTQCLATGKLVFDKPISESAARSISDECRAGLERRDIIARSTPSFILSVMIVLVQTAARLLDPIHDVLALIFGGLAYVGIAKLWPAKPRLPSHL